MIYLPRLLPAPSNRLYTLVVTWFLVSFPNLGFAQNIIETSERSPQASEKIQSLLTVGTSASHPDRVLGNKQALIAAEVRKQLKAAGIQVFAIGIQPGEQELPKVVADGIAKYGVSHTMSLTIPNGTVRVKRSTGESVAAEAYEVKVGLNDAKSGATVWTYTAQVEAGFFFGASNLEVATSIVAKIRSDGLL